MCGVPKQTNDKQTKEKKSLADRENDIIVIVHVLNYSIIDMLMIIDIIHIIEHRM